MKLLLTFLFVISLTNFCFSQKNENLLGYSGINFGTTKKEVLQELKKRSIKCDTILPEERFIFNKNFIHYLDRVDFYFTSYLIDVTFNFDEKNENKLYTVILEISKNSNSIENAEKYEQDVLKVLKEKYQEYGEYLNSMDSIKLTSLNGISKQKIYTWDFLNGVINLYCNYSSFFNVDYSTFTYGVPTQEGGQLDMQIYYRDLTLHDLYFKHRKEYFDEKEKERDENLKSKF